MKSVKGCCDGVRVETVCRLEGLLGVDERGQMVLPKELRERMGLRSGDKLALVSWEREGDVCCLVLIKAEGLAEMVREKLEPVFALSKAEEVRPQRRLKGGETGK